MSETSSIRATVLFNVGLTAALGYFGLLGFLFGDADKPRKVHNISRLPFLQDQIGLQFTVGCVAGITGVLLLIFVIKEFWNRVIVRLMGLREITYAETYALVVFILCLQA